MRSAEELKDAILNYLREHGECTIGEIAKGIKASRSTTSKYLKVLEAEGRVERKEKLPYVYYLIRRK